MSLLDFIVRLAGIVGGILVCSGYAWRGGLAIPQPVVTLLMLTSIAVGNAAARAAKKQAGKRQLTANGTSSRKHDSLPIQSPQKGLVGSHQDGYRPSYL